ncbi:hypothetical protein [Nocardia sp. CA-120079]|uniref:hypothetical protein n=1 Tax=Nocardia sp. CA-120079 TaxID=3239974 RepID=UPI003D97A441
MCESPREFAPGDAVVWWADRDGRGLEPDHPDAIRRTGVVDSVHRHDGRVVAYLVACRGGVSGTYITTVRPDHGHRLTLAT